MFIQPRIEVADNLRDWCDIGMVDCGVEIDDKFHPITNGGWKITLFKLMRRFEHEGTDEEGEINVVLCDRSVPVFVERYLP